VAVADRAAAEAAEAERSPTARLPALPALARARRRQIVAFAALTAAFVALALTAIAVGSVSIPFGDVVRILLGGEADRASWTTIVEQVRIPRTLTAALAGAALGMAGLQMQTLFRNPLADPFILGISAGASFGVAVVVLVAGSSNALFASGLGWLGDLGLAAAAMVGAGAALALILLFSTRVTSMVTLLIVGLMVGQIVTSFVTIMLSLAEESRVQQFVRWGFGSFRGVTWDELRLLAPVVLAGLAISVMTIKPLNALLLGEGYARSMGLNVRRTRLLILVSSSALAGIVTAFAGPIAFLGLAIPHLARAIFGTSDHRVLVPGVVLMGACAALVAEVAAQLPGSNAVLPLNAITALIGAPVVIIVLLRSRRGTEAFAR
jgi:iron complex transport system permease protein